MMPATKDGKTQTKKVTSPDKKQAGPEKAGHTRQPDTESTYFLQRYLGNSYAQSLEAKLRESTHDEAISNVATQGGAGRTIQSRLMVSQPGDRYEQEADRIAGLVMQIPEPQEQQHRENQKSGPKLNPIADQITPIVQTEQANSQSPLVTPELGSRIHSVKGGGQPLSESTRAFFDPRFGYDFSDVRVHLNARAVGSAHAMNARAFTVGHDIIFGAGRYEPDTEPGRKLLAHELTHVAQQNGIFDPAAAIVQRDSTEGGTNEIQDPIEKHDATEATIRESEAEFVGYIEKVELLTSSDNQWPFRVAGRYNLYSLPLNLHDFYPEAKVRVILAGIPEEYKEEDFTFTGIVPNIVELLVGGRDILEFGGESNFTKEGQNWVSIRSLTSPLGDKRFEYAPEGNLIQYSFGYKGRSDGLQIYPFRFELLSATEQQIQKAGLGSAVGNEDGSGYASASLSWGYINTNWEAVLRTRISQRIITSPSAPWDVFSGDVKFRTNLIQRAHSNLKVEQKDIILSDKTFNFILKIVEVSPPARATNAIAAAYTGIEGQRLENRHEIDFAQIPYLSFSYEEDRELKTKLEGLFSERVAVNTGQKDIVLFSGVAARSDHPDVTARAALRISAPELELDPYSIRESS